MLIGAMVSFMASGNAAAQDIDGPACTDLALFQKLEELIYVDHGPEGVHPGDRRILRWAVHDAEDNRIGVFHVITTVLQSVEGRGDAVTASGTIVFPNGDVVASITTDLPDASDTERSTLGPVDWAIVGGTGDFASATGTLITSPPEDGDYNLQDWTLDITMSCPG
ncbi:hypothetical protein [Bauldia sp.]|uniref:hypothetical protein n=1 Tax=Bauldia sp. TaxID=2575872 RepID=UPI003BAA27F3